MTLAIETLEYRGMFGIYRKYRNIMITSKFHYHFACHDERFFVGESNCFSGLNSTFCRFKAGEADESSQHNVNALHLNNLRNCFRTCENFYRDIVDRATQFVEMRFIADNDYIRQKFVCLLRKQIDVVISHKYLSLKQITMRANYVESLRADGTCGT